MAQPVRVLATERDDSSKFSGSGELRSERWPLTSAWVYTCTVNKCDFFS